MKKEKGRIYVSRQGLEEYNEWKPGLKQVLGITLKVAWKMMKLIVKTAFTIPGLVKKVVSPDKATTLNKEEAIRKAKVADKYPGGTN